MCQPPRRLSVAFLKCRLGFPLPGERQCDDAGASQHDSVSPACARLGVGALCSWDRSTPEGIQAFCADIRRFCNLGRLPPAESRSEAGYCLISPPSPNDGPPGVGPTQGPKRPRGPECGPTLGHAHLSGRPPVCKRLGLGRGLGSPRDHSAKAGRTQMRGVTPDLCSASLGVWSCSAHQRHQDRLDLWPSARIHKAAPSDGKNV